MFEELRKLKEKATGGEWEVSDALRYAINSPRKHVAMVNLMLGDDKARITAEYICALHNSADALLAIAEQAEKTCKLYRCYEDLNSNVKGYEGFVIELDKLCQMGGRND